MVYSTRRFVVCLSMCHFVLVFLSPFSIAITSLGDQRANLSAFRTFVRFVLDWICRFPLPLGVWEGLRFVIVALPGLFSYLFFVIWIKIILHYTPYYFIVSGEISVYLVKIKVVSVTSELISYHFTIVTDTIYIFTSRFGWLRLSSLFQKRTLPPLQIFEK